MGFDYPTLVTTQLACVTPSTSNRSAVRPLGPRSAPRQREALEALPWPIVHQTTARQDHLGRSVAMDPLVPKVDRGSPPRMVLGLEETFWTLERLAAVELWLALPATDSLVLGRLSAEHSSEQDGSTGTADRAGDVRIGRASWRERV